MSTSSATIAVWARVQDVNGNSNFGGVDKVRVSRGVDVADLRDAVKLKWANHLAHCDASDLSVY